MNKIYPITLTALGILLSISSNAQSTKASPQSGSLSLMPLDDIDEEIEITMNENGTEKKSSGAI